MAVATLPVQERRKSPRSDGPLRLGINLLQPRGAVAANHVNVSEGGLCLRLQELLEVRSLVRLQVTPERSTRSVRALECTGRVAWVIQRLDLRDIPPFLYDIGIEFVDPPLFLRRFLARKSGRLSPARGAAARKPMDPALIRGRRFIPRVEREPGRTLPWHLIVSVDGVACFSGHYASERTALIAWAAFKRQQGRR